MLIAGTIAILLAGLFGFLSGRQYERQVSSSSPVLDDESSRTIHPPSIRLNRTEVTCESGCCFYYRPLEAETHPNYNTGEQCGCELRE